MLPIAPKCAALDFAYGTRGLETSVIVWETGTELSILVCRETLGTPLGLVPGGAAAAPFSAQVLPGTRLAPAQMTRFCGLPCWVCVRSPVRVAISRAVG